jgi:malonyl-CoA O-methyltransferase
MNIQESYDQWAATYDSDRNLTRDLDASVTRAALGGLAVQSILELGCGTGKNTAFLAGIGRSVRALDFSEGMIAQARGKLPLENVSFAVADLTTRWPVETGSVDLVVCNLVLEHIRDLNFIFSETARVLAAGGRFFLSELHPFRQYQGGLARFQFGQTTREIPAHVHHVSEFLSAADGHGLRLLNLKEFWHAEDENKPPRVLSLMFERSGD